MVEEKGHGCSKQGQRCRALKILGMVRKSQAGCPARGKDVWLVRAGSCNEQEELARILMTDSRVQIHARSMKTSRVKNLLLSSEMVLPAESLRAWGWGLCHRGYSLWALLTSLLLI